MPRQIRGGGKSGLLFPGASADLDHGAHLVGPYAKRCRHDTQLRRIRNIPGLDSQPLRGTHAGQLSYCFQGKAAVLPGFPHKDAEQLAPYPADNLVELLLVANRHTHIHLDPRERRLSSKYKPRKIELHDDHVLMGISHQRPDTAASWLPGDDYYVNFHEGDPFIKVDEGYARLPGEGYAALHPELKDVNPEDYPDIHKLAILADVAPYSREYNTYRQKIGREAQGNTELEIEYEKILARVKKTRESVIRMTDRHFTAPVDEISGTVESASAGGITLKTRSLRPAGNTTPRAPAPEAPCLRTHAHRQPRQQLHELRTGQLSITHSLHRSTTADPCGRA